MRQARAIWLKCNVMKASIKLNKVGKAHDNAFTTRHEGVLRGNRPAKDQEEYEALAKCHGSNIQRTPTH